MAVIEVAEEARWRLCSVCYILDSFNLVAPAGLEPARPFEQGILNSTRGILGALAAPFH